MTSETADMIRHATSAYLNRRITVGEFEMAILEAQDREDWIEACIQGEEHDKN